MKTIFVLIVFSLLLTQILTQFSAEKRTFDQFLPKLKQKISEFLAKIKQKFKKPEIVFGELIESKPEVTAHTGSEWK